MNGPALISLIMVLGVGIGDVDKDNEWVWELDDFGAYLIYSTR